MGHKLVEYIPDFYANRGLKVGDLVEATSGRRAARLAEENVYRNGAHKFNNHLTVVKKFKLERRPFEKRDMVECHSSVNNRRYQIPAAQVKLLYQCYYLPPISTLIKNTVLYPFLTPEELDDLELYVLK